MTNARWIGLFCALFAGHVVLHAQPVQEWHGVVYDEGTLAPLPGTHLVAVHPDGRIVPGGTVTDTEGRFVWKGRQDRPSMLRAQHVGYRSVTFVLPALPDGPLRVLLAREAVPIPEVVVRASRPEVVFKDDQLHVADHCVNEQGIWVLTYERAQLWHVQERAGARVLHHARLFLLDSLFRPQAGVRMPEAVARIHKDHRGNVLVEGVSNAWAIRLEGDELALERVALRTLEEAILPWTDTVAERIVGSDRSSLWPAFRHIAYSPVSERQEVICSIQDDHVMSLFRSQYKYMSGRDKVIAMDMEIATGVEREVIAGYMSGFHRHPYFRVPYAPLFVVNDTLLVFDHLRNVIRKFLPDGTKLNEVRLDHPTDRHWSGRLLHDRSAGVVYAQFAQGASTWLRPVNVDDGSLGSPGRLSHRFPANVQVHNGWAYYTYRPQGGVDRQTLYRERIR